MVFVAIQNLVHQINTKVERILKYHPTSQAMKEVCLEDLIKSNQASHQGAWWTSSVSMLKVPVFALIIETSTVWPWYRRSFQGICRGLDNYSRAYLWLIPMIFRMVFPSCFWALMRTRKQGWKFWTPSWHTPRWVVKSVLGTHLPESIYIGFAH
jgi:hypothetical protein